MDSLDQDLTAQKMQSDLDLNCPQKLLLSSTEVKDLKPVLSNM